MRTLPVLLVLLLNRNECIYNAISIKNLVYENKTQQQNASTAVYLRSLLFGDVTRVSKVVSYRRFGIAALPLK